MNKRPSRPSRPAPQRVNRPATKAPPTPPPSIQRRRPGTPPPPPRPMVTAAERQQQKLQRRSSFAAGVNNPGLGGVAAGAAAGAAGAAGMDAFAQEQSRFNALQSRLMLSHVQDELEDIEGAINALPANVENIRARGYVFKSYLEK